MDDTTVVAAIVLAAGDGTRAKFKARKQFFSVKGSPLLAYTLDAFYRDPCISYVVTTVPELTLTFCDKEIKTVFDKSSWLWFTKGGDSRHRSIRLALQYIDGLVKGGDVRSPDVVLIHDGVRPLVDSQSINQVVKAAYEHGAAGCVTNLTSTIVACQDDYIRQSLDRSQYVSSETPQAFQWSVIRTAYEKCCDADFETGTECLDLALRYAKCNAKLIPATDSLFKVTYYGDLWKAEILLTEKYNKVGIICRPSDGSARLSSHLVNMLEKQNIEVTTGLKGVGEIAEETNNVVFIKWYEAMDCIDGALVDATQHVATSRFGGAVVAVMFFKKNSSLMDGTKWYHRLKSGIQRVSRLHPRVMSYGVAIMRNETPDWTKMSASIVGLISHRDVSISGQVLVLEC